MPEKPPAPSIPASPPPSPAAEDPESRYTTSQLVLRLLKLTWRYRLGCLRVLAVQCLLLMMSICGLGLTGLGIDVVRTGFDPQAKAPRWPLGVMPPEEWTAARLLLLIGLGVLLLAGMRFVLDRFLAVWQALLVQALIVDLRSEVYAKLQKLSFRFFDDHPSGSIINRVTGDVQSVRRFVDFVLLRSLVIAVSLLFYISTMLSIHPGLTVACLATTPLLWVLLIFFVRIVRPAYRRNRELFDEAVRVLAENAQGVHVVKSFGLQDQQLATFVHSNAAVRDQKRWIFQRVATFIPLAQLLPAVNLFVLLLYGGYLYVHDPTFMIGGGLFVFAGLLTQLSSQIGQIAQVANTVQQSLTGAQRVFEVLDTPLDIEDPLAPRPLPAPAVHGGHAITFEQAHFGHDPGAPVLRGIDLHIEPGQTVALLGMTGAGKSSLMNLIPRFYDPSSGCVKVSGVDVRELRLDELRRSIGVVFQESFLFSNTVAENIAFGHPEASMEQIREAARKAAADDFIEQMEQGYDTLLTEGGGNLSGGQRQRLAIARALLLDPPILLMDDPTAALDAETEQEILATMAQASCGRTTLIVAHRLSTLRRADRIIVLENGRIVQDATHQELMRQPGLYRQAAELQTADAESLRLLGKLPPERSEEEEEEEEEGEGA